MKPTKFSGEFSEFTYKTCFKPSETSFWSAFCLSLFEGLNRLKGLTEEIFCVWQKVFKSLEEAKKQNRKSKLGQFEEVLRRLKEADKITGKGIIEEMFNGGVNIVKGGKGLACGCMENEAEMILNDQISVEAVMKGFSLGLGIHIICFTDKKYRLFKCDEKGPIMFLYNKSGGFSVVYHYSVKYFDEKNEIFSVDFKKFPFFYSPNSKLELKLVKESDSIPMRFIEISNLLAYNIKPLDFNDRNDLKLIIMTLKSCCPELKEKFEELYGKIISICKHKGKEYTPVCLQRHCAICLMDAILESNESSVFCSCNVELSKADVLFLSGQLPDPNNNCRVLNKPVAHEKVKNRSSFINTNKLPAIRQYTFCFCCKMQGRGQEFVGIYCSQHQVCLDCRANSVLKGFEKCPICKRDYTMEELTILKMRNKSIDLTSSVLAKGSPTLY